jgi:hypothetical protein
MEDFFSRRLNLKARNVNERVDHLRVYSPVLGILFCGVFAVGDQQIGAMDHFGKQAFLDGMRGWIDHGSPVPTFVRC